MTAFATADELLSGGSPRNEQTQRRRLLLAAAAIAMAPLLSGCSGPQPPVPSAASEVLTLPLDTYFRGLRTLRVNSDVGLLTLLFDTGGGATSVIPEVAARMGCEPYGRDVAHRMSGERAEFQQCPAITVQAGQWRRDVAPLAVFDVNALLPRELPRLDGVLALDAFRGQVITLDWPAGLVQVHTGHEADRTARARGLPFRAATGNTGRMLEVFLPVDATRGQLWFLLDSGNIRGTLVSRHAVEDRLLPLESGAAALVVAGHATPDMPIDVDDLIIDGALGTAYLMAGPVALDLRIAAVRSQ